MDAENWNILLVEDDQDDYFLIKTWLAQAKNGQFTLNWQTSYEAALQVMQNVTFDVVLVDYQLGSRSGLELIREAMNSCQHLPFILLTGHGNYELDLIAMEAGVSDYLSKAEITPPLLERSIRYAIAQKRAEMDLRRAYAKVEMLVDERTEELLETRRQLMVSVETERKRLAQEIHDGPIQDLLGITYLMIGKSQTFGEEEFLINMQGAISRVVDSLRDVCKELRSASLAPFNLAESIHTFTEEFRKKHPELAVSIVSMTDLKGFPERSRLALYRIFQQAMANAAFHAQAKNVFISVTQTEETGELVVEDNGGGFIVPACLSDLALNGHFGLVGSFERAVAVGGTMEIESKPGKGTLIRAIVPLKIKMPV
jgi:signal transduction histidine kinase